jgi:nitrite reductase (NO-forming)
VLHVPVAVLHAAVAVRLAGDLAAAEAVRVAGGLLAEIALLVFAGCAAALVRRARRASMGR